MLFRLSLYSQLLYPLTRFHAIVEMHYFRYELTRNARDCFLYFCSATWAGLLIVSSVSTRIEIEIKRPIRWKDFQSRARYFFFLSKTIVKARYGWMMINVATLCDRGFPRTFDIKVTNAIASEQCGWSENLSFSFMMHKANVVSL